MIFFIISFAAGGSSPSLKGKLTGTPYGGSPFGPVPLMTQQSVTLYLLDSCKLRF